jgi:5S rRNA maturation endonuclease (ribonuclease M5)
MDYKKTLEEIEKTLSELREENETVTIIVEGEKDVDALRKLGITGNIVRFNTGMSIPNFCDMISKKYDSIILLTDWDRKGGFLCSMLKRNLECRVLCITKYRKKLAKNSMTKTIEGLPSWIETLKQRITA